MCRAPTGATGDVRVNDPAGDGAGNPDMTTQSETTVAVSFSECGGGMVVDEVDADLLAVLHRAVPATKGHTRRLVTLG